MPEPNELLPVFFLDTNCVHFSKLYLEFAQSKDLPPIGANPADPEVELAKVYPKRLRAFEDLNKGRKYVEILRAKTAEGIPILFSPITRFELVCGLLRGKALRNAAVEGLASRMWSRIDEKEIFHRLEQTDYTEIHDGTKGLEDLFKRADIVLSELDPRLTPDVWKMVAEVLGVVFLDLGDGIVYASAVMAEADELISDDGYLRSIANGLFDPGEAGSAESRDYFQGARTLLLRSVAELTRTDVDKVRLPKATIKP